MKKILSLCLVLVLLIGVTELNAAAETDYVWRYIGVQDSGVASMGYVDSFITVTDSGVAITSKSSVGNNGGLGRFLLGSGGSSPINGSGVLHQHFSYTPGEGDGNQRFGIRGNNGYQWNLTFNRTDRSIRDSENSVFSSWSAGETYEMDYVVDLSNYKYYWLINGRPADRGSVYTGRRPLWQICYNILGPNENMTLSNMETTLYNTERTVESILEELLTPLTAPFSTNSDGYGDFEPENYSECYDASAWTVKTDRRFYSGTKALGVCTENKNEPDEFDDPTLNLSFTANKSGRNTYYLWIRHTASVANQSGQNCFLSLSRCGRWSRFKFSAEEYAPQWICLGAVDADAGKKAYVRIRHRQQNHIAIDRYVITADAEFVPTDAYYQITPAASSTAYSVPASKFSSGRVCFEAEDVTKTGVYSGYSLTSHFSTYGLSSNFSGKDGRISASGSTASFNKNWATEPNLEFNFTAPTSGSKYLWARIYSTSTNKKFAVSVNCSEYKQVVTNAKDKWYWQLISVIDGVQANLAVNVRIYNVVGGYAFDEFAISDNAFDTPQGKSISWNTKSDILTSPYSAPTVTQTAVEALSHPRIYFTAEDKTEVAAALSDSENQAAYGAHAANVARGLNTGFTGALAMASGYANNSPTVIGTIEALAFEYAINGNRAAGQKAVSAAMNYLNTVSYTGIASDSLTRVAGYDIAALSRVYDWCWQLFTQAQKDEFISKCEQIIYQMDIGWPPADISSVTGYGAEGIWQNYLLTFAIAVADERADIYNYVIGRIQDQYIPERKTLYASGESLQGSRYGTYRGQHDLTAALLLATIGYGSNVYGEGLSEFVNWYIYARRPDGLMFVDGDDTNNSKAAGEFYTVGHMQNAFVIAARLFEDPYIKNEAKKATRNFTEFGYEEGYISPASFLAINRPTVQTKTEYGFPLSKYFGYPNGNIIARTGWPSAYSVNDNTVVAFMKTGIVNVSNHQHLDAGNFQLYYKGILANDPCYYTGSNYNSAYMNAYARRSVAHNTVLVRDGVSRNINGLSVADGGQVPVTSPTGVDGVQSVAAVQAYDFGGEDINQPDYSYLKSDLTNAYGNSVSSYNRSMVFLNMYDDDVPGALVVFDRLQTKNTSHKTAWLLHGLKNPTISGNRAVFALNSNGYTGKMVNDTLLPEAVEISSVADGYLEKNGTFYGSGYNSGNGVNESEGYRVEVSPQTQGTQTNYLNVIQVGETDAEFASPGMINNDTFVGTVVKDRVVLFSKSGNLIGEGDANKGTTQYFFDFSARDDYIYKFAVTDTAEGKWEVSYSATGVENSYSVIAWAMTNRMNNKKDKGYTISFSGRQGYYRLKRVSNTHTENEPFISEAVVVKQLAPGVKLSENALCVAPRNYSSIANSTAAYSGKLIISVYDKQTNALEEVKILDFIKPEKNGKYIEMLPADEDKVIKTLLADIQLIRPLAPAAEVYCRAG